MRRRKSAVNSEVKEVTTNAINTIKAVEFPDKTFTSKVELFKHLKANEEKIISLKRATVKHSEGVELPFYDSKSDVVKGIEETLKDGFIYPIINTTKYMDSHNDVHLNNIWNKSVRESKGKIFYISDHELKLSSVIAHPKDVEMSVKEITWKDLGKDLEGSTQALMFKVSENEIVNEDARKIIANKTPIEHSVRMEYIKVNLALNSDEKEDKAYKKLYDKHINDIANKEVAIEKGYFWAVGEAKISKEGSMVLLGSNDATPMLYPESEPSNKDTQIIEPLKDTQENEEKSTKRRR